MNLGSLNVRVGVDLEPLKQGLNSARGQAEQFARTLGGSSQSLATAERALGQTGASATKLSQSLATVGSSARAALGGLGALSVAGAVAGAFAAAVRASVEFNKELANIQTVSGVSAQRLAQLRGSVQQLAMETGQDTTDLAKGLYQVQSAFGDTADSARALAIAAKLGIGGLATTEQALAITSATTKAYGNTSATAQKQVADLALTTVRLGQTTLPELSAALGKVTPLTAALKISQQQLFAVMATGVGVTGTASEVSTQFRGILQSLMAPTATMTALLKQAGVTSGEALIQQRGFAGAVQLIVETANASHTPLQQFIGSIEGQTLALALAGPQAQKFIDTLKAMGVATGELERAFDKQAHGVNKLGSAWDRLSQTIKVAQQNLAQKSAPYLEYLVEQTTTLIQRLQHAGPMLSEIGKGIAGIATGHQDWGETGPARPGQRLTPEQVAALQLGPVGKLSKLTDRPYGPALPAGFTPHPTVAPLAPTKEQIDAHNKIADALKRADFEAARAAAVRYHGELSLQTAALDLYGKALETLNAGQRKSAAQFLESEKNEQRSQDAVKAGADAITKRARAEEEANKKRIAAHERYQEALKDVQAETRDITDYTGMNRIRREHPGETPKAQKALYDAQQWRDFVKARDESSAAAKREENATNQAMAAKLKEAQINANAALAQRKYGEINRETIALQSQWAKSYLELEPHQRKVIDGLYELATAEALRTANSARDQQSLQTLSQRYAEATQRQDELSGSSRELAQSTAAFARSVDLLNPELFAMALAIADMDSANEQLARGLAASEKEFEAWAGQMGAVLDATQAQQDAARQASGQWTDLDALMAKLGLTYQDTSDDVMLMVLALNDQEKAARKAAQGHSAMEALADKTADVFMNAFRDMDHGFKGFFKSVQQGFTQMLEEMAMEYLKSELKKQLFKLFDPQGAQQQQQQQQNSGGGGWVGLIQTGLQIWSASQGGGAGVAAGGGGGGDWMTASAPSRGRYLPPATLAPATLAAAGAHGGGQAPIIQHLHFHGITDANSIRQNRSAIQGDMYKATRKSFQRDG